MNRLIFALCVSLLLWNEVSAARYPRYTDGSKRGFPDDVPYQVRAYWMRQALRVQTETQGTNCPFGAFGAVIVNRTDNTLLCTNSGQREAPKNPAMHAENAAVNNCSAIMAAKGITNPGQRYDLWNQLDMYATGEPCPMDCGALLQSRFNTVVWSVSIQNLIRVGFDQIDTDCDEIAKTWHPKDQKFTRFIGNFLEDEILPHFSWQYDYSYPCPMGCQRTTNAFGPTCSKIV